MSRAAAFSGRPSRFSKFACAVHSVSSPEPFTSSQWNTATRDGERSAAELRELEQLLADIDAIIGLARRSPNRGETGLARKHAVGCSTKRRLPPERRIQSTRGRPCRRHRWRFEIVQNRGNTANRISSQRNQIDDVFSRRDEFTPFGVRDRYAVNVHEHGNVCYVIDECLKRPYC